MKKNNHEHIGIGIDAGGTYTDAVIYDISSCNLLGKYKSLTTKWDYTLGIRKALEGLSPRHFQAVRLVALSTTLATNAIVEGDGQKVGLMIMPPYGLFNPDDITYKPFAVIKGEMEITGEEITPVDIDEVKQTARRMVEEEKVQAFAVSGFAGSINPAHELAVKAAIKETTGCGVTCGHELSDLLNFKTRAYTAVFNARLIPRLVRLLKNLQIVLDTNGIKAPIVVVKGDGTLMSAKAVIERPVETILSGPAASVSGARHLTGIDTALVVDMGGTTTDTAALENGIIDTSETGSKVGNHQTHVKALAIRTTGLGGDSLIHREISGFKIGPRRVVPVSYIGSNFPGIEKALAFAEHGPETYASTAMNILQFLILSDKPKGNLSSKAKHVVSLLEQRPYTIAELIECTGAAYEGDLGIESLEEQGIISRSGLTPVDLLHAGGRLKKWDCRTAERYLDLLALLNDSTAEIMISDLLSKVTQTMTLELIKRELDEEIDPQLLNACPVCKTLIKNIFKQSRSHYKACFQLMRPIIGIGAPVGFFLPDAAAYLNGEVIIPEHSDVANAIGAVISEVVISRRLRILSDSSSGFVLQGTSGVHHFKTVDAAEKTARKVLTNSVLEEGRKAGTSSRNIVFQIENRYLPMDDGNEILKARIIIAKLAGPPTLL